MIFWSRYNRIEAAIPAGIAASHSFEDAVATRDERSDHSRPVEVTNSRGSCSAGRAATAPQRRRAAPIAGAKLARFLRSGCVRYLVFGRLLSVTAVPKVKAQVKKVIRAVTIAFVRAFVDDDTAAVTAKDAPTSPTAWAKNKTDTNTEKISSVHRDSFFTRLEADVSAIKARHTAATDPVAAYKLRKGSCREDARAKRAAYVPGGRRAELAGPIGRRTKPLTNSSRPPSR